MSNIKVIPARKVLSGGGTLWEYALFKKGWNELAKKDKYGFIVGCFKIGGSEVCDVHFPKLDITLKNIFFDEIKLYA